MGKDNTPKEPAAKDTKGTKAPTVTTTPVSNALPKDFYQKLAETGDVDQAMGAMRSKPADS